MSFRKRPLPRTQHISPRAQIQKHYAQIVVAFLTAMASLSYSNILLKFLNKAPLKNPRNLRNLSLNLKTGQ